MARCTKRTTKKAHPLQIMADNLQTKKGRRLGNHKTGVRKQRYANQHNMETSP